MWYNKKQIGGSNFLNLNIMNSKNKLTSFGSYKGISLIISVLILSLSISYFAFAWSEPTAVPPGDNVSPPLNISSVDQSKEGGLILNTGGASANGLVVENGNVGVGVVAPNAKLEIDMGTSATEGLHISRTAPGANSYFNIKNESSNSVFKVHESGNVGIGTTDPEGKLTVVDGAILASGTVGGTPVSGRGTRMMWIPEKAAFRAGTVYNDTEWDDANIGNESFAVGEDTTASGWASFASGDDATASGYISTAMGWNNTASGDTAVAMGGGNIASGNYSFAVGYYNRAYDHAMALGANAYADSIYSVAIGEMAEVGINSEWSQAIGHQVRVADNTPKAMVLGIGSNTGAGVQYIINDIPSSLMVGFNSDTPTFFVGPSAGAGTTGSVGIGTIAPGAKLEVAGDVMATTFLYSSDERLKKNIIKIESPLEKIMKLDGVSFTWKENGEESIGIIAQNLEEVFPELVKTNEESGMKSVEYGNLVAPIIEAIKEQQKMIEEQKELINNQQEQIDVLKIKLENIAQ